MFRLDRSQMTVLELTVFSLPLFEQGKCLEMVTEKGRISSQTKLELFFKSILNSFWTMTCARPDHEQFMFAFSYIWFGAYIVPMFTLVFVVLSQML